ncbi:hypothetical protein ES332_D01G237500v1 [Gossypium tomentosum]|uniref:Uncharacterized protein n=1 Tax=Gossypium tomentosum TaxID=34277 RepID=A0A5D2MCF4_GOSTO|nr:hypothetical protein ES332_D01G237500v1 [Gossypium tomentosum]
MLLLNNSESRWLCLHISRRNKKSGVAKNFSKSKSKGVVINDESIGEKKKCIQCHVCHGFRHIQVECVNTLKNKKSFFSSNKDDEHVSNYIAITTFFNNPTVTDSEADSDSDIESNGEFLETYKTMLEK